MDTSLIKSPLFDYSKKTIATKKEDDEDNDAMNDSTLVEQKNDDNLNDEDLNKLDDSIDDDLYEQSSLFQTNKRKLNDLETRIDHVDDLIVGTTKIMKLFSDDKIDSSSFNSPSQSPSSTNKRLNNDHFTLLVSNKQTESCLTCECLVIESVSENCYFFLKLPQV